MATTQSKRTKKTNGYANGKTADRNKSTPPTSNRRGPTFRDTSRPSLLDEDSDAYELGWLIPTSKAPSATEPVCVRARPTETGWLGYLVAMSAAEGAREFSREMWSWGTPEQCAQLDSPVPADGIHPPPPVTASA